MNKNAYITNLDGSVIIDFQYSPHEMDRSTKSNIKTSTYTGSVDVDLYWVSGEPESVPIPFFIDRTKESMPYKGGTQAEVKPKTLDWLRPVYDNSALAQIIRGMVKSKTPSEKIPTSEYNATPHFKQNRDSVLYDIEVFESFLRPEGYKQVPASVVVQSYEFRNNTPDNNAVRFVPPQMIRFFYSGLWVEGYLENIDYKYSIFMSGKPQRVEGTLTIAAHKKGTFEYVNTVDPAQAELNNYVNEVSI